MGQSKKAINQPIFERRRREHNIVFTDECPPDQWPDDHRDVFEAIEKLKGFKYATYAIQDSVEAMANHPWKADAKLQARRLVDKAKDLVSRNEPTWRLGCEPLVFNRLAAEVACDEKAGLNQLFIDRSDDFVIHPPKLAEQLPQEQKPDRVYGLRQTRIIEDLLLKRLPDGALLEDILHKQPHSTSGQALLFPFLVVEAKSGTAPDDWHSIRLQTAFPIYTYLNAQQSLRLATAQRSKWTSGPLVWFFMSKGDDWRLALAYQCPAGIPTTTGRPNQITNIATVWTGCITNRDAALQLFLIVDYLSDWARDVYRAAVIRELRVLAAPDTEVATVFTDTDIFSTRHVVPDIDTATSDAPGTADNPSYYELQAAFKRLDTACGVVRHAAPIQSRFLALFLTQDNIQTFIDSTSNHIRQFFIRQIIRQFSSHTVVLTPDEISSIEREWTGHSRLRAPFHLQDARFFTVYIVAYSLLPSWDQARDLCLIAVQEEAFGVLLTQSKLKIGNLQPLPMQPASPVMVDIALLKNQSIERNLLACIERTCGFVERYTRQRIDDQTPGRTGCEFERCSGVIWLLLGYIYKFHKKGDLEPDLPFLRISAVTEIQRPAPQNADSSVTLEGFGRRLYSSDQGAALVHGDAYHHFPDRSKSAICVYLVSDSTEPPNQDELARIIKNTFEDRDVYHTTRDYGTLNIRNMKEYQRIWNLERTYGVFFSYGKGSFVKWLRSLGKPLPTRQGSPRGPNDDGRIMFTRNYSPWHDPRLIHGIYNNMLKKFWRLLFAAEVTHWARMAQERIQQGHDCCFLCATVDPEPSDGVTLFEGVDDGGQDDNDPVDEAIIENLCWDCAYQLSTTGPLPAWLKRAIKQAMERVVLTITGDSAPPSNDPGGYCISTPPRSPFNSSLSFERRDDKLRLGATPSDSEVESEDETRGELEPHTVSHDEDQADETPSVFDATSSGPSKRAISSEIGDQGARKRRKRRLK
ncbi:hypothetical protein C8A03DRAFT_36126 [Achaetomium macrosporum]|uniref:Uncharacterized protein n=1 Tax=Achaetomium macrosporum TaxID=79813 RepID=A0AAN7C5Y4_9PEZI|nr:hypothetical protein C8A03DRAFT_36126 [Achaetomium macrosporum]